MKTIMIIDDEANIRTSLQGILQDEGYSVLLAADGESGINLLRDESADLIMLDIWMPGIDGLETLRRIREINPEQQVVMMSGHGTIETAVKATRLGAYDFIEKPLSLEKVLLTLQNALRTGELLEENRELKGQLSKESEMIGESPVIRELKAQIAIAAPTSGWVLITGENGTGKELVARAIHNQSKRRHKSFVEVNCAAIPEELIESELFGHERGSFTGATSQRRGKFDLAHEGTLFLDEIADMSLKTQAKVLRILQERKFERVGGSRTIEVDVRVIAATNKNLETEISSGRFREDLYYRLNVIPFHVPPLRDRCRDIPRLAGHFLALFCQQEGLALKRFSDEALRTLCAYSWPGNVRELKNIVERLVIMSPSQVISEAHLPAIFSSGERTRLLVDCDEHSSHFDGTSSEGATLRAARDEFEKEFILQKLKEFDWNISKTADAIEIERSNLHRKMKTYGIEQKKN